MRFVLLSATDKIQHPFNTAKRGLKIVSLSCGVNGQHGTVSHRKRKVKHWASLKQYERRLRFENLLNREN